MNGVEFIVKLRCRGEKSDSAIRSAYKEQFGNLKEYQADLKQAKSHIKEYFEKNIHELGADIAMHLWDLYSKNYKLQDYRECRTILKQIVDFSQIASVEKTNQKADPLLELMKLN